MDRGPSGSGFGDLPGLPPILAIEETNTGWRALTERGDILDVKGENGERAKMPTADMSIMFADGTTLVGQCTAPERQQPKKIKRYVARADKAVQLLRENRLIPALSEIDGALRIAKTERAKFNRSLILLALGRWQEGLAAYEHRFAIGRYPVDDQIKARGIPQWRGESLAGKSLLITHDEGFGDTIQMLRYAPRFKAMGADAFLLAPQPLQRLAETVIPTVGEWTKRASPVDYFSPVMSLWLAMQERQAEIPRAPYLTVDPVLRAEWAQRISTTDKRRIGIAWSVGIPFAGDYPRQIPLLLLAAKFRDAELYSLQTQEKDEARALGVHVLDFEDFADVAAIMSLMDEVVCVDTAALHLAGAIGHSNVIGLLSHWASWRWKIEPPLYPDIRMLQQQQPDDWESALAQYVPAE